MTPLDVFGMVFAVALAVVLGIGLGVLIVLFLASLFIDFDR